MVDWEIASKIGFPVKNIDSYMNEIITLVYQSNVKDVDNYTYKRRNPYSGSLFKKGISDLHRSQILCNIDYEIYSEYEEYCQYVLDTDDASINAGNVNFDFLVKYFQKKKRYLQ